MSSGACATIVRKEDEHNQAMIIRDVPGACSASELQSGVYIEFNIQFPYPGENYSERTRGK